MLESWLQTITRATGRRRARTVPHFVPHVEALGERIAPSVTSSFKSGAGILRVTGDNQSNNIVVTRTASNLIVVNGARVATPSGFLRAAQLKGIFVNALGGNDTVSLIAVKGVLPKATMLGGEGNDSLTGGFGPDMLLGGAGNDTLKGAGGNDRMFGEAGVDLLLWNEGDGNDFMDGGADNDTVQIRGAQGTGDTLVVGASGGRASLQRINGTPFSIDIGTSENLTITPLGGADTITIHDLAGSGVSVVNVDLGVNAAGDGAADSVLVNGSAAVDVIQAVAASGGVQVNGLAATVNITLPQAADDRLTINGLGNNDTLSAGALSALIQLTLDGGAGNDTLNGGNGADVLIGGDGNDTIDGNQGNDIAFMGAGNDIFVWDPGDASDIVEGQDGQDTLRFNGSVGAEVFAASSNGGRLQFTRNVGNITMDTDDVETLALNALGGTDSVTINDLAATDVAAVNIDLGVAGAGDGASDAVTVNGTVAVDVISLAGSAGTVTLASTAITVTITNAQPANDTLTVNSSSGADLVSASGLANSSVLLTINGGADDDILVGSQGNDTINGDTGNDLIQGGDGNDTLNGGSDTDTIDGGAGTDTAVNGETVTNVP